MRMRESLYQITRQGEITKKIVFKMYFLIADIIFKAQFFTFTRVVLSVLKKG